MTRHLGLIVLSIAATAGCQDVFGTGSLDPVADAADVDDGAPPGADAPPTGRFCDQPAQPPALFCEDFDAPGADDAATVLANFSLPDLMQTGSFYEVALASASSPPRAAELRIASPSGGSPDARLTKNLTTQARVSVTFSLYIAASSSRDVRVVLVDTPLHRLFVLSSGSVRTGVPGGATFSSVAELGPLPIGRWLTLTIQYDFTSGGIVIGLDGTSLLVTPTPALTSLDRVDRLELGPAEPAPSSAPAAWTIRYDNVLVRAADR